MKTSLYNQDGTLSTQAQSLLSPKPDDVSMAEWRNMLHQFEVTLSEQERTQFKKLRKKESDKAYRERNYNRVRRREQDYKNKQGEEYKLTHRKHSKTYRNKNKEKHNQYNKKYRKYDSERQKAYRLKNKEKTKEYQKSYYQKNKEVILVKNKKWMDNKLYVEKNERYIAMRVLRTAVCNSFTRRGVKKNNKTEELLGASWDVVQAHFESLFTEGMSWSNRGKWHVDHIRPVSSFEDLHDPSMNHYTNLQPLWAEDNFAKSDKWNVDASSVCLDANCSSNEEVQETRGTQKEKIRSTGCRTP